MYHVPGDAVGQTLGIAHGTERSYQYVELGIGLTLVVGIGSAITNPWIVRILAPSFNTQISLLIVAVLTFYISIRVWTYTFAMLLQSMNDLLLMWLVAPIQSLLSIWALPLRCWLRARSDALT